MSVNSTKLLISYIIANRPDLAIKKFKHNPIMDETVIIRTLNTLLTSNIFLQNDLNIITKFLKLLCRDFDYKYYLDNIRYYSKTLEKCVQPHFIEDHLFYKMVITTSKNWILNDYNSPIQLINLIVSMFTYHNEYIITNMNYIFTKLQLLHKDSKSATLNKVYLLHFLINIYDKNIDVNFRGLYENMDIDLTALYTYMVTGIDPYNFNLKYMFYLLYHQIITYNNFLKVPEIHVDTTRIIQELYPGFYRGANVHEKESSESEELYDPYDIDYSEAFKTR